MNEQTSRKSNDKLDNNNKPAKRTLHHIIMKILLHFTPLTWCAEPSQQLQVADTCSSAAPLNEAPWLYILRYNFIPVLAIFLLFIVQGIEAFITHY